MVEHLLAKENVESSNLFIRFLNAIYINFEIKSHVKIIEEQNKLSNKDQRMTELKNWLDYLNAD